MRLHNDVQPPMFFAETFDRTNEVQRDFCVRPFRIDAEKDNFRRVRPLLNQASHAHNPIADSIDP